MVPQTFKMNKISFTFLKAKYSVVDITFSIGPNKIRWGKLKYFGSFFTNNFRSMFFFLFLAQASIYLEKKKMLICSLPLDAHMR